MNVHSIDSLFWWWHRQLYRTRLAMSWRVPWHSRFRVGGIVTARFAAGALRPSDGLER